MASDEELINLYLSCLKEVLLRGWAGELKERREARHDGLDALDRLEFFKQYGICVFQPRYRWEVLKRKLPSLAEAFRKWDFEEIAKHKEDVERKALEVISRKNNIRYVIEGAQKLSEFGWDNFKKLLIFGNRSQKLQLLDALPGIGMAEKYELARNIGVDVGVKPDRYWLRCTSKCGYPETEEGVQQLGERMATLVGEREEAVDYIVWRACEGSRKS